MSCDQTAEDQATNRLMLSEAKIRQRVLHLDIWYPRQSVNVDTIELGLQDVRATDNIRISYDFDRDGWKIEQASTFEWEAGDPVMDEDWQEVAFIQAWGRKVNGEIDNAQS